MLSALTDTFRHWFRPVLATDAVRLVIVTKNSAPWIGEILDAYSRLGIVPKVLLDASSTDGTEEALCRRHMDYEKIWPELPRVEAAVRLIGNYVKSPWVFRVDDDELPSLALLRWIDRHIEDIRVDAIGVPRRWIRLSQGGYCEYSSHPLLAYHDGAMDAQWRLFQPGNVQYTTDIHTPGFSVHHAAVAPKTAYIAHFDWIIRSREKRLSKIENYDRQSPGAGGSFRDLYVWEDSDIDSHRFQRLESKEFDRLARILRRAR